MTGQPCRKTSGRKQLANYIAILVLLIPLMTYDSKTLFPGIAVVLPVFGTALLIHFYSPTSRVTRVLASKIAVWIGDRSYEWYLWHLPIITFIRLYFQANPWLMLAGGMGALPLAHLTHTWYSEPIRRNESIVKARALWLGLRHVTVSAVFTALLVAGANHGWGVEQLRDLQRIQKRSVAEDLGCDSMLRKSGCLLGDATQQTITLVGDSHAAAISDVFHHQVTSLGAQFGVWTRPGCPFLSDPTIIGSRQCALWTSDVLKWVRSTSPDVLVLHMAINGYIERVKESVPTLTSDAAINHFVSGLQTTLRSLNGERTKVLLIEDVPSFGNSQIETATLLHPSPTPATRMRAELEGLYNKVRDEVAKKLQTFGVRYIETLDLICPDSICSQRSAAGWLYRDGDHVTPLGASLLGDSLNAELRQLLSH